MQKRLIINADDFGLCQSVNRGIQHAHIEGMLTSTTLMTNMPGAFDAVNRMELLPDLAVGVHLNLTEGKPLSRDGSIELLVDADGNFSFSPEQLAMMSIVRPRAFRRAVALEFSEQIQWLIKQEIRPTHIDSHKHLHAFCGIFPVVRDLAWDFGINIIRWPFEPRYVNSIAWPQLTSKDSKRSFFLRNMSRMIYSMGKDSFRNTALLGVAHTGRINEEFWDAVISSDLEGSIEVMTHPGFTEDLDPKRTRLVEQRKVELEALCNAGIKDKLINAGYELTHYGEL